MEALVNGAFDRIHEDFLLLYDALRAYEEASPRPPPSAVLFAIRQVLKEEDKGRALGLFSSPSREHLIRMGLQARVKSKQSFFGIDREQPEDEESTQEADDGDALDSGLTELVRVILTSVASDLAVLPFWMVKVSAIAHRGRLPCLWPFQGFWAGFTCICETEGFMGLFKGWLPVCVGGILRHFRRRGQLYSDYYSATARRLSLRLLNQSEDARIMEEDLMAQSYDGLISRTLWAAVLHPFDLIATRMITERSPAYRTASMAVSSVVDKRGWGGLFVGVRVSITNAILPFGNWYTLGIPFVIKTRRMMDGMDQIFRVGLGGSLDLMREIIRQDGISGLFAGWRATCWGLVPAFGALCAARAAVYLLMGSSSFQRRQRRRRRALLRRVLSSQKHL